MGQLDKKIELLSRSSRLSFFFAKMPRTMLVWPSFSPSAIFVPYVLHHNFVMTMIVK